MKKIFAAAVMSAMAIGANAQIVGDIFIHDPSTIVKCNGIYYTFGTGSGGLMSEDGYTWKSGPVKPGGGVAPDAMKIGDRYLITYSGNFPGTQGKTHGVCQTMWATTLHPDSVDYTAEELVAWAGADDDCYSIDPALLLDPTTGRLWMSYGTYFGAIRIVELDPKTAKRLPKSEPVDIAIDCEATALMYHNGWYYLLGTHGTCCDGVNSTYNIVCGRSREVTGPYLDNVGRDMLQGGGKMVLSAGNRVTGPGHFGQYIEEEGCEKMTCHFEADFDRSGKSVLGIRALLWKNDWPVAADPFQEGTYEIESERRGYALELGVDFVRMQGAGRGFGNASTPDVPLQEQLLSDVIGDWPKGNIDIRLGDYMFRPHQKWTITAVGDKGGYLGQPYYRITIAGTNRALAATADGELTSVSQYSGAPEQLWRIEQLIDGTYRIINEHVPGQGSQQFALVCTGDCSLTLGKYDFNDVNCKWNLRDR